MLILRSLMFLLSLGFVVAVQAQKLETVHGSDEARAYLQKMLDRNSEYVKKKGPAFFAKLEKGQDPVLTLVSCSDSRVQTGIIDSTPEGDAFVIRNIGNQIPSDLGSIKYGVNHLKSQMLLIMGHSNCGAIKAASGDYSNLEPEIVRELVSLHVDKNRSIIESVEDNVHYQVQLAMERFSKLVAQNNLLVVGAVYDFADDMHQGAGRLNVINIQGKKLDSSTKTGQVVTPS